MQESELRKVRGMKKSASGIRDAVPDGTVAVNSL